MDLPNHGPVSGMWDLRGKEDDYIGHVALDGKRVLEIGPASGCLTFHMESRGAEVVAVELAPGEHWDNVPHAGVDVAAVREKITPGLDLVRKGFWFAHKQFASRSRVHYGRADDLPAELGRFDIATMGCVLLHNRDPLGILAGCARVADAIVVTEMYYPDIEGRPVARLAPRADLQQIDTWWEFSPEFFVQYLGVLGYANTTVTYHSHRFKHDDFEDRLALFTVVGTRAGNGAR